MQGPRCQQEMAQQERTRISERTKLGMARARSEGRQFGRPPLPAEKKAEIRKLLKQGLSTRAIAVQVGCGHGTVQRLQWMKIAGQAFDGAQEFKRDVARERTLERRRRRQSLAAVQS